MKKNNTLSLLHLPIILFICSFVLTSCLDSSNPNQAPGNLLEEAKSYSEFDTFVGYLSETDEAELDSTIANEGPFTVLIPTEEAFDELPEGTFSSFSEEELTEVLSYHIVEEVVDLNNVDTQERIESMQGNDLYFEVGTDSSFVNSGQLLASVGADNGVIYQINKVMLPDSYLHTAGLISKRYQLDSLDSALSDADLQADLADTTQNYTVFAPEDEAFEDATLQDALEYHVVPQKLMSDDFSSSQTYETLSGEELTVEIDGENIIINGEATVSTADIEGNNGVVHIIDTILEVPSKE
ncbi:fasciclin domain-containing protein [Aliifodinibius salicampi]|uniref:Fasciclin domain-containing protein n=1 Tax=Fodinibius salicampi TaxID=1920655 RepID=A0ABT3PUX1_9BACT|nr:fasciclin domain-containing protein [Fodinibius salicampi]MCW9711656.1 fasciclin domain-containing protein [Fodinibius salicampi]